MQIDPLIIVLILIVLVALGLVIEFFMRSAKRWHQESDEAWKSQPLRDQLQREMRDLNLPEQELRKTVNHLTRIVQNEVLKEMTQVRHETGKAIAEKEQKIIEIQNRYEEAEKNYQTLGRQKTQTEAVVRSIAKGVIVLDDNGKVVFINPDAEKILGAKSRDLLGKAVNNLKGDHVMSMVNEEGVEEKTGSDASARAALEESTAVIETVRGQTKGVISIASTVNQEKKMEKYKNEFLANISHELRSPLICIQKSIAAIRERIPSEEKDYLDIALRNAQRLESMVNEILDLSKAEAGKIVLRYDLLTLKQFVEEIRQNFSAWANDKNIEIKTETPAEPLLFEADKERLSQVISNFVANAMKFTPRRGKITIVGKSFPQSNSLEIGVQDTGPGIAAADQPKIFQKFAFINTNATEGEKGTGLGLALCKEIVHLHGGRIWVDSKEGEGSYFAFSIPAKKS